MHSYIINASIQILPIVLDKHPYLWVDEAMLFSDAKKALQDLLAEVKNV